MSCWIPNGASCVRAASGSATRWRRQPQLTFIQRGDRVELTTFPGEQLDNPYAMNTIDICPVGALTSREFRFKARVWEMSATETICPGCARGCNMYTWVRNNEILRQTPRYNPDVNEYWMCDRGRLETSRRVNADTRIKTPLMKKDGEFVEIGWDEAIARAASEFRVYRKGEVAVLGSAFATNEDNYLLLKFARDVLGTHVISLVLPHVVEGDQDDIPAAGRQDARTRAACWKWGSARGVPAPPSRASSQKIHAGDIKALFVLHDNIAADPDVAAALGQARFSRCPCLQRERNDARSRTSCCPGPRMRNETGHSPISRAACSVSARRSPRWSTIVHSTGLP